MESVGKQANSDTSSDENDLLEQVKEDTSTTKRSYECNFCKRGFTNAQALGGHMNIHRKDRAKAKQITVPPFSSKPTVAMNEDFKDPRYTAPISSEAAANYYPALEAQRNYLMYYQPSVSNPKHPHALHDGKFLLSKSQSLSTNEELWGANLSLGIGSTCGEDNQVKRGIMKDDELDLELRLGNNP